MRKISSSILFLLLIVGRLSSDTRVLKRLDYYPKSDSDYYFKPICSLAAHGNTIYGVENLSTRVVAFRLDYPQFSFSFFVGRPGQGPGDLLYPMAISIWGDSIAIKEASAFSLFGLKGIFQSKFKIYSNNSSFVFHGDRIFWLNPSIKQDHLIEVYSRDGERILTIGKKSIIRGVVASDPNDIDRIYEGMIFLYGQSIYYLSSKFGCYSRYTLRGDLLAEGDITEYLGERGAAVKKYNTDVHINHTRKNDGKTGYPKPLIFEAASLYKNFLYLMGSRFDRQGAVQTILDLKICDLNSMSAINSDFVIEKEGICRIDSFIILEDKGKLYLLLSITVIEEGHYLKIYEIPK